MIRPNAVAHQQQQQQQTKSITTQPKQQRKTTNFKKQQQQQKPLPFSFFAIIAGFVILSMGIMSVYTVLFLTTSPPKDPSFRKLLVSKEKAIQSIQNIRNEFHVRYGTNTKYLQDGLRSYGDITKTAYRILLAKYEQRAFQMSFSGYSITVGRGNYFHQSFPFILQGTLQPLLESIFDVPLNVHNGAIGGIPSFPYGFCMEHFMYAAPDVISWDYSMNEGNGDSSILEAWIRQSTKQLASKPMIIMLDKNPVRNKLLEDYVKLGYLQDAVSISKGSDVVDIASITSGEQSNLPPGLQHWDEFGAPAGCPGRGSWHPKKMEHEFMGWLLIMHFMDVLQRAVELVDDPNNTELLHELEQMILERDHGPNLAGNPNGHQPPYAKPISTKLPDNDGSVTDLLYGHKADDNPVYQMKDLSCRTSFLPATDSDKVIPSIVVSGMGEQGTADIMIDRTDEMYQEGWVLDVSKLERDTKRKVERCGGLGYIDMKIALYGTADSGPLRLWLPFEKSHEAHEEHDHDNDGGEEAAHYFDDLILCEANEKRKDNACKLDRDLQIKIGGIEISNDAIQPIQGAGEYLKRTTCVNVPIPTLAKTTHRNDVTTFDQKSALTAEKRRMLGGNAKSSIGLTVDIVPASTVKRETGACCLSHIVWEQH